MDRKISLDLAHHTYLISIPAGLHQTLFSSVFAKDRLLKQLSEDKQIILYGYCLFESSIHLLIETSEKPSVWIEPFLMEFNQWHQKTTGDSAYLFNDNGIERLLVQPRFSPIALRYLHQLPVLHRKCGVAAQYLYTSYHDYLNDRPVSSLNSQFILALLSPHSAQRKRRYQNFMAQPATASEINQIQRGRCPFHFALSDEHFVTRALTEYTQLGFGNSDQELQSLWQSCIQFLKALIHLDESFLLGISRHHSMPDAHHLLAWLFVHVAKGSLHTAAKLLGVDEETLQLNIRSVQLHHPATFLRYIVQHWNQQYPESKSA